MEASTPETGSVRDKKERPPSLQKSSTKNITAIIAIIISLLSVAISASSFFYQNVRQKHELRAVFLECSFDYESNHMRLALINGGNRDIMVIRMYTMITHEYKREMTGLPVHVEEEQNVSPLRGEGSVGESLEQLPQILKPGQIKLIEMGGKFRPGFFDDTKIALIKRPYGETGKVFPFGIAVDYVRTDGKVISSTRQIGQAKIYSNGGGSMEYNSRIVVLN